MNVYSTHNTTYRVDWRLRGKLKDSALPFTVPMPTRDVCFQWSCVSGTWNVLESCIIHVNDYWVWIPRRSQSKTDRSIICGPRDVGLRCCGLEWAGNAHAARSQRKDRTRALNISCIVGRPLYYHCKKSVCHSASELASTRWVGSCVL